MSDRLPRVTGLFQQAFEDRPACAEDRQCLQEIAARGDQGCRQLRRPVNPWGLGVAMGDVIADLCYGSGEGRIGRHG